MGGYLSGGVGVYDPATGESKELEGIEQPEGMAYVGDTMFFGVYPRARLYKQDLNEKWDPELIKTLEDEGQDRPFAMLGAEDVQKLYFGTVPSYGLLGGAFVFLALGSVDWPYAVGVGLF